VGTATSETVKMPKIVGFPCVEEQRYLLSGWCLSPVVASVPFR